MWDLGRFLVRVLVKVTNPPPLSFYFDSLTAFRMGLAALSSGGDLTSHPVCSTRTLMAVHALQAVCNGAHDVEPMTVLEMIVFCTDFYGYQRLCKQSYELLVVELPLLLPPLPPPPPGRTCASV